jgi:cell division protein FtsW (lipid II flippase)
MMPVAARWRERMLLVPVAACLLLGVAALTRARPTLPVNAWAIAAAFLVVLLAAHLVLTVLVPRADQTLLPLVGMLAAVGLVFVLRLAPRLAPKQLLWHAVGVLLLALVLALVADVHRLRRYKYVAAVAALALMLITAVVGRPINGSRLWLGVGSLSFQVTEAVKVLLVVFLAGYLADRRLLLRAAGRRWRGVRLPTLPYLLPMGVVWVLTFLVLIWQRDLGATLLLAGVTLVLLYVASGRVSFVVAGLALVLVDVVVAYHLFGYVRERIDVWLHPFSDAPRAYQIAQALYAVADGSVLGAGLGRGFPNYIPAVHTDFVFAAAAEELGLAGAFALVALYLLVTFSGLRVAQRQPTDFATLLALGCTAVFALQALVIIAGNLALIPLTGITLPFVSYGGSSIIVNYVLIALLLRLSLTAVPAAAAAGSGQGSTRAVVSPARP